MGGDKLLPALGFELLCRPVEKLDLAMVGSWDVLRLRDRPVYLGLTEGKLHHGVLALVIETEDDTLTSAFESILSRAFDDVPSPPPAEAFLVRGMDEAAGPILCLQPVSPQKLTQIRAGVGTPGTKEFAPQIRVLGVPQVAATGAGELATMTRRHATAVTMSRGSLWLDFAWSAHRPGWHAP